MVGKPLAARAIRLRATGRVDPLRAGSRASELLDQVAIVAGGLALQLLQAIEDYLDPIDGSEDQGYGFASDGHAVPEFAHQRFGGMSERLEPR